MPCRSLLVQPAASLNIFKSFPKDIFIRFFEEIDKMQFFDEESGQYSGSSSQVKNQSTKEGSQHAYLNKTYWQKVISSTSIILVVNKLLEGRREGPEWRQQPLRKEFIYSLGHYPQKEEKQNQF